MRTLVGLPLCFAIACGGSRPPPPSPAPAAAASPQPRAAAPSSDHKLTRSGVRVAVGQGLGVFLQKIEIDDHPVLVGGRFHGFRVAALHDAAFWTGVDLRPGDVVTSVNGLPIERPEQAEKAFESLESASELRVSIERDGKPRELVYPITDDR